MNKKEMLEFLKNEIIEALDKKDRKSIERAEKLQEISNYLQNGD